MGELVRKPVTVLILLILIGTVLRFYNLNWGAPYYFHPDERNIAFAVTNLRLPDELNPKFFAYGSLPIYIIFFVGIIKNFLLFCTGIACLQVSFESAILISRVFSAILSVALIPLLFLIGKRMHGGKTGIFAAALGTFSTGFIQFAHFGTFEMWLTFFGTLLFYLLLRLHEHTTLRLLVTTGITLGILLATKVSSAVLFLLPALSLIFIKHNSPHLYAKRMMLILATSTVVYVVTNPFVFLDYGSFNNSMRYESGVALGTLPVFYSGGFYNTIPVLYQLFRVYPFLLNPLITILFLPAFAYLLYQSRKTKRTDYFLLTLCYFLLFTSQTFLFVKWTRYMVPTLPFMYLAVAILFTEFLKNKAWRSMSIICAVIVVSIIFSFSYVSTVFIKPDTRVEAALWAERNITHSTQVLSEVYDLGIVPFNDTFTQIDLFNFYELDARDSPEREFLPDALASHEYIILPSQRILQSRLTNQDTFPNGARFYKDLIDGNAGFEKVYETRCDIFCRITYLNNPIFAFEQTASVFDRPTVKIFKKQ